MYSRSEFHSLSPTLPLTHTTISPPQTSPLSSLTPASPPLLPVREIPSPSSPSRTISSTSSSLPSTPRLTPLTYRCYSMVWLSLHRILVRCLQDVACRKLSNDVLLFLHVLLYKTVCHRDQCTRHNVVASFPGLPSCSYGLAR